MKKRVLFAILNMGLGHASRSLPIVNEFIRRDWQVVIGSSGRTLTFLRQELPHSEFLTLPDYNLEYTRSGVSYSRLISRLPGFFRAIQREHRLTEATVQKSGIRLVISDHHYGCYSGRCPSYFISHQLRFVAPGVLRPFEFVGVRFNQWFHKHFTAIIIPDLSENGSGLLSGRLSRIVKNEHYHYAGILSSLKSRPAVTTDIDILVSVSGPEPQRSVFETIVREQIPRVPGKKVVVLGKPEISEAENPSNDLVIYPHLSRETMADLVSRSRIIVSRSGYSTIMELAETGRNALLIPTPGQTEQEYLARRYRKRGWFHSVSQDKLNLERDIPEALKFDGLPPLTPTAETVKKLFNQIFPEDGA